MLIATGIECSLKMRLLIVVDNSRILPRLIQWKWLIHSKIGMMERNHPARTNQVK